MVMPASLDHIVMAVPNLAAAQESFRTELGLQVLGGGRHDGAGTENAIVPLHDCYLELVTVVDPSAAAANPFGRLVTFALDHHLHLAGWAIACSPPAPASLSHQRLTREGVAVDLYGIEEITAASHRPFGLVRPPHQPRPGAEARPAARLVRVWATAGGGLVDALTFADPPSLLAEDGVSGHLAAIELVLPDGSALTLTSDSRS